MGLRGPFPATAEIETEEEGWALLEALGSKKRCYVKDSPKYLLFDKLYARVLSACGDD
jgi:hypothetical protein